MWVLRERKQGVGIRESVMILALKTSSESFTIPYPICTTPYQGSLPLAQECTAYAFVIVMGRRLLRVAKVE
jgi:hypothetical protein